MTSRPPVITVTLHDDQGAPYEVQVNADDWAKAQALTMHWRIEQPYDKPLVVSRAGPAILHRQRDYRALNLPLTKFIMEPPYGETVRHLDGDTLNVTRDNLVVRRKGAPLHPKPRKSTAKELELQATCCEIFHDPAMAAALRAEAAALRAETTALRVQKKRAN